MLAALCAWPGAASAADYYNVQIFAMGGGGKMYVIDFHYASRKACTDALDARARAFRRQYPDYTLTAQSCSDKVGPYAGILANKPAGVPYFTFQDMRQWIGNVSDAKALDFCRKTARNAKFGGRGRCME